MEKGFRFARFGANKTFNAATATVSCQSLSETVLSVGLYTGCPNLLMCDGPHARGQPVVSRASVRPRLSQTAKSVPKSQTRSTGEVPCCNPTSMYPFPNQRALSMYNVLKFDMLLC